MQFSARPDQAEYEFSPAQVNLRREVRGLLEERIRPRLAEWAGASEVSRELVALLGQAGLLGVVFKPSEGGMGREWLDLAIVLEEIGRVDSGVAMIASQANFYTRLVEDPIIRRDIICGRAILAFAETEARSGGDVAAMSTVAKRVGNAWVIRGSKTYISLVPGADWLLVTALTNPEAGNRGMSLFLVDSHDSRVKTRAIPEPGLRSHMLGSIQLDDVVLGREALLGEEGSALRLMRACWDYTRSVGAARVIGGALDCLEKTLFRATTEDACRLDRAEVVAHLMRSYIRVRAARTLCYQSAMMADRDQRVTAVANMMKTFAHEVSVEAVEWCVRYLGIASLTPELPMFQRLVDLRGLHLAGGGNGIGKLVLGMELFGREFASHR